jgi:hypothetical protein
LSSVISLEEAARRTGLTKRQIGDKVAEGKLRIERDPVTGEKGIYPHTLRGLNGYQPPEPPPPPRPQAPPPPKPEPWLPSHAEMAALIKLDDKGRAIRIAELVRRHPHLAAWFRDNPLPPVFRKQEPPPRPEVKPPPPPPPPQSWQTSWQGQATWQQYQVPPKQPEPPPFKPAPPDPPKRREPPPDRPAPPKPHPGPSMPSPGIGELLRLLLVELFKAMAQPFADSRDKLNHATSERRERFRKWVEETEYAREFAKLWENKAGRALIIIVGLYIAWRIL